MLFVVEQRLIKKHGFGKTLFPPINTSEPNDYYLPLEHDSKGRPMPLVPKHGNSLLAHLLVEGMKHQPCRPTFANARDAIIQADVVLTGGNNTCEIWQGFAERGLGPNAKTLTQLPWGGGPRSEDFSVPKICMGKPTPKNPEH
jgi:extracellular elastinolytic metalloproteinase